MASTLKDDRYKVELWMDRDSKVEDEAFGYPVFTRSKRGALSKQEQTIVVKFAPSAALKAMLETELKAAVDTQLAR